MKKTMLVMRNEIGVTLRRKTFLIFAFIIPILIGVIAAGYILIRGDTDAEPLPATEQQVSQNWQRGIIEGFVDETDLIASLPDDIPNNRFEQYHSQVEARSALKKGAIDGYYVIPADYIASGSLFYVREDFNIIDDDFNSGEMEWVLKYNLLAGNAQLAERVKQPVKVESTSLATVQPESTEDNWFVELFPTIMVLVLYMVILIPAGILISSMTDEKKNRVMEVLMISVSSRQLLTGKILAVGLLGLLQTTMWIGVMMLIVVLGGRAMGIPSEFTLPVGLIVWSFIYFLLGYGMYGAQMAGIGALASDTKETKSASFFVMAPLILCYMFMVLIFRSPNSLLSLFLSLFPLTAPIAMIARMSATAVPIWQPALSALIQFAFILIAFRLIARLFRAQSLLSGQPFSVQGYYKALLGRT